MACCYKVVFMMFTYSILLNLVVGKKQVPCYFIFGDSLVDNGNNNDLNTFAKAFYLPHGIDFSIGPTGRFCNGRTIADITAELLGFDTFIPPFVSSKKSDILQGLNYASSAAGIRNESGQHLGDRIDLDGQLRNHNITVTRIAKILGSYDSAASYLKKCFYQVGFGNNDYLNNYFIPSEYPTSSHFTIEQFTTALIRQYHSQILRLYDYGARRVALHGLGPIGCIPNELARHATDGTSCVGFINAAIQLFNHNLKSLVDDLNGNTSLREANFTYINIFDMSMDIIRDPSSHGFRVVNSACCGLGLNNGGVTCLPLQIPCENRSEYFFWDAYHTTEAANILAARRAYRAVHLSDAYPLDIHNLLQI